MKKNLEGFKRRKKIVMIFRCVYRNIKLNFILILFCRIVEQKFYLNFINIFYLQINMYMMYDGYYKLKFIYYFIFCIMKLLQRRLKKLLDVILGERNKLKQILKIVS